MPPTRHSRDKEEADLRLKVRPLQVIQAIKESSLIDLRAVFEHISYPETFPFTSGLTFKLVQAICHHFADGWERLRDTNIFLLTCVQSLSVVLSIGPSRNFLKPILIETWPGILDWMQRALGGMILTDTDHLPLLASAFSSFLASFPEYLDVHNTNIRRTDALKFTVKLWSFGAEGDQSEKAACANIAIIASSENMQLCSQWLQAVLEEFPDSDSAAKFAINQLGDSLVGTTPVLVGDVFCFLRPIHIMCSHKDHPLRKALISNRGIPLLVETLKTLQTASSGTASGERDKLTAKRGMQMCLDCLAVLIDTKGDIAPAQEAFKHGFLTVLVLVYNSLVLDNDSGPHSLTLMSYIDAFLNKLALRLFMNAPIIITILRAVQEVSFEDMEQARTTGPLRDEWMSFFDILLERIIHHRLLANHLKNGTMGCANPGCSVRLCIFTLHECAGCRAVLYCSSACQKAHWKTAPPNGHRDVCKDSSPGRWSTRERLYKNGLAERDIARHLPSLRKRAQAKFPSEPFQNIAFRLDYTKFPTEIDVVKVGNVGGEGKLFSGLVEEARKGSDGSIIWMNVFEGSGASAAAIFVGHPKEPQACGESGCSNECQRRAAGRDPEGKELDIVCDNVDKVVRRLRVRASIKDALSLHLAGGTRKPLKEIVDSTIAEMIGEDCLSNI